LILCDVNVLIYAFRSDTDKHTLYRSWLESAINGPSAYGISPQVLASVVRICTHPRIFKIPSSLKDVFEFCRVLLEQPNATVIVPGDRHWPILERIFLFYQLEQSRQRGTTEILSSVCCGETSQKRRQLSAIR
jgi:predicted nucleic acid-binding protein